MTNISLTKPELRTFGFLVNEGSFLFFSQRNLVIIFSVSSYMNVFVMRFRPDMESGASLGRWDSVGIKVLCCAILSPFL